METLLTEVQVGSVCWQGVFFLFWRRNTDWRYGKKGEIINEQYYVSEIMQLNEVVMSKRKEKQL